MQFSAMNELLPIIRRVRRPLLVVEDAPPVAPVKDETPQTLASAKPVVTKKTNDAQDRQKLDA